ncbi:MAG: DUF4350 domain-containing protein, partial [Bacteroidales bacterium]|nr:DUF4350 domain-containing protein [Bacteroidales bacterium]
VLQTIMVSLLLLLSGVVSAQQVADTSFNPPVPYPEYAIAKGPLVMIDEGHNNFHTASGRYLPFARLLRSDGYRVDGYRGEFTAAGLKGTRILVIANALNELNVTRWYLPTPSAFSRKEIKEVKEWVKEGGSLFLIADHMPMGGAAYEMARAYGFEFTNGFAMDTAMAGPAFFLRDEGTLANCLITNGRADYERIDKAVSFTGQAFKVPGKAEPIMIFNKQYLLLEPDTAWVFDSSTRFTQIGGWAQGAYMESGKGRIVFFGEAAMFTAQLAGPDRIPAGMNSDYAGQNYQLLLNIIHWLDRRY